MGLHAKLFYLKNVIENIFHWKISFHQSWLNWRNLGGVVAQVPILKQETRILKNDDIDLVKRNKKV